MTVRTPLLGDAAPVVGAPMAGGATTLPLAGAVAEAGGFPFLAAGYKRPDAVAADIAALREHHEQFGVNVFVAPAERIDPATVAAYAEELRPDFERFGLTPDPTPRHDDDLWDEKLALLRESPVPIVSFTFGLPRAADIAALRRAGSRVLATVTVPAEARAAAEAGVDGLVVQGAAAGGHSATFDPHREVAGTSTAETVRAVRAAVSLPVIAAGGVDGPDAVRALFAAGAEAVAVGTLLLRTDESGAAPVHQAALADPRFTQTAITRAFTGRPARGLRNEFIDRHPDAPVGYPELHHLTRPLRTAAARAGDTERLHLWAGTGYRAATPGPAADVVASLLHGV